MCLNSKESVNNSHSFRVKKFSYGIASVHLNDIPRINIWPTKIANNRTTATETGNHYIV